jgi:hypothetical protein
MRWSIRAALKVERGISFANLHFAGIRSSLISTTWHAN